MNKLLGNYKIQKALINAIKQGTLHHTLLFSGTKGIGKATAAKLFAKKILCLNIKTQDLDIFDGCGNCSNCKTFNTETLPDLIYVKCDSKESGSTEQVKKVISSLRLKPFTGDKRVVILDEAHKINRQAANALLKSLEEPRAGNYFILITDKPTLLLKTIHSRAQRWGFVNLSEEDLRTIITEQQLPFTQEVIPLAAGSIYYYTLLTSDSEYVLSLKNSILNIAKGNTSELLKITEQITADKEKLSDHITILSLFGYNFLHREQSLRWANFIEDIGLLETYCFQRNLNPYFLIQHILLKLASPFPDRYLIEGENTIEGLIA